VSNESGDLCKCKAIMRYEHEYGIWSGGTLALGGVQREDHESIHRKKSLIARPNQSFSNMGVTRNASIDLICPKIMLNPVYVMSNTFLKRAVHMHASLCIEGLSKPNVACTERAQI